MAFYIDEMSVMISPLSFLIMFIWVLYLLFLAVQLRVCHSCFSFKEITPGFVDPLYCFSVVCNSDFCSSFYYFYLISALGLCFPFYFQFLQLTGLITDLSFLCLPALCMIIFKSSPPFCFCCISQILLVEIFIFICLGCQPRFESMLNL